ncbi:MAG TPA: alpha/beta fold hydrolase [Thermoanaerobaculia bacterium]|nr:alpha/beta fold hydrolase [Thermoanaerobaculia bacterium]
MTFPGPAGRLEGLWKSASRPGAGSAVFAHPHPLFGGTLHNKVVFRAARALSEAGYGALRFNFRGVGQSDGAHDSGAGEVEDFRAALDEAERRGGLPIVAGGFSFGSAAALRAIPGDPRVAAGIFVGVPLASESGAAVPAPSVPSLFVTGEKDTYGPPALVTEFVGNSGMLVVEIVPGADHFFDGKLDELEAILGRFLASLPAQAAR